MRCFSRTEGTLEGIESVLSDVGEKEFPDYPQRSGSVWGVFVSSKPIRLGVSFKDYQLSIATVGFAIVIVSVAL